MYKKIMLQEALTEDLREELVTLIGSVVKRELTECKHFCRFAINEEEASEIVHAMRLVKNLGDGDLTRGIQVSLDNHKWMKSQRERSKKISTAFFIFILTTVASGLLIAMWHGFKAIVVVGK